MGKHLGKPRVTHCRGSLAQLIGRKTRLSIIRAKGRAQYFRAKPGHISVTGKAPCLPGPLRRERTRERGVAHVGRKHTRAENPSESFSLAREKRGSESPEKKEKLSPKLSRTGARSHTHTYAHTGTHTCGSSKMQVPAPFPGSFLLSPTHNQSRIGRIFSRNGKSALPARLQPLRRPRGAGAEREAPGKR